MAIDVGLLFRSVLALLFVLALITGATWLAKRYLGSSVFTGLSGRRRLGIVETLAIDSKSRLMLVRRDDTEHLVLLAPGGTTVIETGLPAKSLPAGSSGALMEKEQ
jgi:flagellar protein FliO/FliZ